MLNFTLRQIEYFRAAAEHGSISAAAEKERVSRSALAAAVSDLETVLGYRLFIRQKAKGVVLTPYGSQLFELSTEMMESAARIATSRSGSQLTGRLGIGCFTSLGPTLGPSLFDVFQSRFPALRLDLRTGNAEELSGLLRSGDIELALGYGIQPDPEIDTEELAHDTMHVIAAAESPLAAEDRVRPEQLRDEPLILLDATPGPENVRAYFTAHGLTPRPAFRFQDFEVVRSLVARGIGYSLVIQRPVSDLSYEGLPVVVRALDPPPFPTPIACAWLRGRALTPSARAARAALRTLVRPARPPG